MRQPSAIRRSTNRSNVIAERLRLARRLHDPPLTLQAVSDLIAATTDYTITKTMLIRIEGNQRSVYDYEVRALADVLKVDVRFLLGVTDDPHPT